jgi:hypothetical protein
MPIDYTGAMYLAVGPMCFGRGDSVEEAVKNMKREWPASVKTRPTRGEMKKNSELVEVFYSKEGNIKIDGMGRITGPKDLRKLDHQEMLEEL